SFSKISLEKAPSNLGIMGLMSCSPAECSTRFRSVPLPQEGIAERVLSALMTTRENAFEPFDGIEFPLAEILDAHELFAFRAQKLHKGNPQPFCGATSGIWVSS